jgi:hypothetical protein
MYQVNMIRDSHVGTEMLSCNPTLRITNHRECLTIHVDGINQATTFGGTEAAVTLVQSVQRVWPLRSPAHPQAALQVLLN